MPNQDDAAELLLIFASRATTPEKLDAGTRAAVREGVGVSAAQQIRQR
jgi:hypothetical protein